MTLIFKKSRPQRFAFNQVPKTVADDACNDIPAELLRKTPPILPQVSELQVIRHYTKLSHKNFSIDSQFYPLGSCTMKYNPRSAHRLAMQTNFLNCHPASGIENKQGLLQCLFELQHYLQAITGMAEVALSPMAGSQGELVGVAMIKAYHHANGDYQRNEILIPDAAHGTNPASAVMCGYQVRELPTNTNGDIDLDALKQHLGPTTAGIMLTNPSTLGVFDRNIEELARLTHAAGGLLYYDGANLNAVLGKVRPGDMGFDVMHLNLHKTFATPHGGGGPGAGPVAANQKLAPYLPIPLIGKDADGYCYLTKKQRPQSIGRVTTFIGNVGVLLRAYIYLRVLGKEGLSRVADFATLNANYLMKKLQASGFDCFYPDRLASHEFIITLKKFAKEKNLSAKDIAKRLLDYDCHAPTTYFPLLIPECFLIEPTETEDKQALDEFIAAMIAILNETQTNPEIVATAPHNLVVKRLDETKASRLLDIAWKESN